MKSTAASCVVGLGLFWGVLVGCGGGYDGPRDAGIAGGGALTMAGSANPGAGGTASAAGSSAGGSVSSAGAMAAGSGGMPVASKPCGPAWVKGTTYAEGAIVLFGGAYYIAEHENPGYDPVVSTYFWEPYICATDTGGNGGGGTSSGGSGAGGSGPLGDSAFDDIVTEAMFNQMFPDRNPFYTYQGLVEATRKYPAFAGTGSDEQRKREAAAFLGNVARETGELVYIEQIQKDVLCSSSAKCPCEPGKSYYGRGPIQISWNYNYCTAGDALGYNLRQQPELVATNATIAWATGLWFWMTQRGAGTFTPHDAIVGDHGFGETIRSINGDVECNGGSAEGVTARVNFYGKFCQMLGVTPGANETC